MYTLPGRALKDIPVLETKRLRLRAPATDDFEAMCRMWNDERYVRHIGNRLRPSGEVWMQIQKHIGSWGLFGYGYWVIEDRMTGQFIGEAGFAQSRRSEASPALPQMPEAGWGIAVEFWGKGIVSEAVATMYDWADIQDPEFPSMCIIDPAHIASARVAQKAGLKLYGPWKYGEGSINVYIRNADAPLPDQNPL